MQNEDYQMSKNAAVKLIGKLEQFTGMLREAVAAADPIQKRIHLTHDLLEIVDVMMSLSEVQAFYGKYDVDLASWITMRGILKVYEYLAFQKHYWNVDLHEKRCALPLDSDQEAEHWISATETTVHNIKKIYKLGA